MKNMLETLTDKPVIGIISGIGSGGLFTVNEVLLNESVLKTVAGYGVYLGFLVAGLTFLLKAIELYEKFKGIKK